MAQLDQVKLSRLFDAPVEVTVRAGVDPTVTDTPRFALLKPATDPQPADWNDGTWDAAGWSSDTTLVTALTPPMATTWTLVRGLWVLWYTTDNVNNPDQRVALVRVT